MMLRYVAAVRWRNSVSSEEVAERCALKKIRRRMRDNEVRICEKGDRGSADRLEEYREHGEKQYNRVCKVLGVEEGPALDPTRWRRIITVQP